MPAIADAVSEYDAWSVEKKTEIRLRHSPY